MGSESSKSGKKSQAVIVNSGIANACTGEEELQLLPGDSAESGRSPGRGCGRRPHRIHRRDRSDRCPLRKLKKELKPWVRKKGGFTGERKPLLQKAIMITDTAEKRTGCND